MDWQLAFYLSYLTLMSRSEYGTEREGKRILKILKESLESQKKIPSLPPLPSPLPTFLNNSRFDKMMRINSVWINTHPHDYFEVAIEMACRLTAGDFAFPHSIKSLQMATLVGFRQSWNGFCRHRFKSFRRLGINEQFEHIYFLRIVDLIKMQKMSDQWAR